mgnify:CR=1 FL=1
MVDILDARQMLTELIRQYYSSAADIAPTHISEREFGFGEFGRKISIRHIAFENEDQLRRYLVANAPPYVSFSSAYYKYPGARPMENKKIEAAELVFDLDATDMDLSCQKVHGKQWVCQNCLHEVKRETTRLIEDFLIPDFGFDEKEISINFSGNRGYHVHVVSDKVLTLDNYARNEISSYIRAIGIDFESFFPTAGKKGKQLKGPKPSDIGWGGRIARSFIDALHAGKDSLMKLGMDSATATRLYRKKALVELGINNGNWDMVYIKKKEEFWSKIINNQSIMQSDKIDKNVTSDATHLIRLPNSIHGDTGLISKKIGSIRDLERFDPMRECIAFKKGEAKIKVAKSPELTMNGMTFGPFEDKEVRVPMYVAVYLYLKGYAEILDVSE